MTGGAQKAKRSKREFGEPFKNNIAYYNCLARMETQ